MENNLLIVDIDVKYSGILKAREDDAYVSSELFFRVSSDTLRKILDTDILYSQFSEDSDTVLNILEEIDAEPFDGASTGTVSLAKKQIDTNYSGHSNKIRNAIAGSGATGRVVRICHTFNLMRREAFVGKTGKRKDVVVMLFRAFELDRDTLEQTDIPVPNVFDGGKSAEKRPMLDNSQLLEFLAKRKRFVTHGQRSAVWQISRLGGLRDYMSVMRPVGQADSLEAAEAEMKHMLVDAFRDGLLRLDRTLLKATLKKQSSSAQIVLEFRDEDRAARSFGTLRPVDVVMDGLKFSVRQQQPLVLFSAARKSMPNKDTALGEGLVPTGMSRMLSPTFWNS